MVFKVTLYLNADEFSHPEYQSQLSATKDDTYATFRGFLEGEGLVDFGSTSRLRVTRKVCFQG
jgi:hypothetical protein